MPGGRRRESRQYRCGHTALLRAARRSSPNADTQAPQSAALTLDEIVTRHAELALRLLGHRAGKKQAVCGNSRTVRIIRVNFLRLMGLTGR
jgi:hypothetical protein